LATLAVQYRGSSRQLVFDQEMKLYGRLAKDSTPDQTLPSSAVMTALAFTGIHVISPRIFSLMIEDGVFSIITAYLRLANQGEKILGFRADDYEWRDLGTPESLQQAAENMQRSGLPADESPASE
jgi:NDP-sugar pyrophosphorylase family protein